MPPRLPLATALLLLFTSAQAAQLTILASIDSSGVPGNAASSNPALTPDGRCLAFDSRASNLVGGDSNGKSDVFIRDLTTHETTRVSIASSGAEGNDDSYKPSLSADCRFVAFSSYSTNLASPTTSGVSHLYLHDRQTRQTRLISQTPGGEAGNGDSYIAALSADGHFIAYYSHASNLVPGDNNNAPDIFVFDLSTGLTILVSRSTDGQPGNGDSYMPAISADGRYIAYESWADNLAPDDHNNLLDIFLHDRQSDRTTLVSRASNGAPANGLSQLPALSADGRWLAYASEAPDLVPDDHNGVSDIFLHDRINGTTERISISSAGQEGERGSFSPALSADATRIAYTSFSTTLVPADGNGVMDIYLRERTSGQTLRVSVNASGNQGDGPSDTPALSTDGRLVAFTSSATNLEEEDHNGSSDIVLAGTLGDTWVPIPQAGWWWNPTEPGQGFFIETRGSNLYLGALLYAQDGRAIWHVSGGPMRDAHTYQGPLLAYSSGQTLTGAWQPPWPEISPGDLTLRFSDESHVVLDWPGGSVPLQRFPLTGGAPVAPPAAPEAGWWWNPAEPGRGFVLEAQGDALYLASLAYESAGASVWLVSGGVLASTLYQGEWLQYAGGQTLNGAWQPARLLPGTKETLAVQFLDARHATLTLPDGRNISLTRFMF